MLDYRIYYEHETYSGPHWDAPAWGVLLIVEKDREHGRRIVSNGDYYVWDKRWWAKDWIGLVDYLQQPGPKKVIFGRMVPNEVWNETFLRADNDEAFPVRTGQGCYERVNV